MKWRSCFLPGRSYNWFPHQGFPPPLLLSVVSQQITEGKFRYERDVCAAIKIFHTQKLVAVAGDCEVGISINICWRYKLFIAKVIQPKTVHEKQLGARECSKRLWASFSTVCFAIMAIQMLYCSHVHYMYPGHISIRLRARSYCWQHHWCWCRAIFG